MKAKLFWIAFYVSLVFSTLFPTAPSAEWAYYFVVWDNYIYVTSDEVVDQIDKEIGEVTLYSTDEGTYSGNFSNRYAKGTKYFSIKDVSTDVAIAIQDPDGQYYKANREGQYAEGSDPVPNTISTPIKNNNDGSSLVFGLLALIPVLAFGLYVTIKRRK